MAEYDLIPRMVLNLDRQLEFFRVTQLYNDALIQKAKIDLLNNTNMVDYAIDIYKTLYHTEVPQDIVERRADVVARLKSLVDAAAPLVSFLQNPAAVQELRPDKHYNLQMLNDRYQIGPAQIEALHQYAKFQFEGGNYSGAADYLYQYRALCTSSERSLSALWGKLAAEILMQNWDIALEELNRLKEIIDSKNEDKMTKLLPFLEKHVPGVVVGLVLFEGFVFLKKVANGKAEYAKTWGKFDLLKEDVKTVNEKIDDLKVKMIVVDTIHIYRIISSNGNRIKNKKIVEKRLGFLSFVVGLLFFSQHFLDLKVKMIGELGVIKEMLAKEKKPDNKGKKT